LTNRFIATYLDGEGYEGRRLVHAADALEAQRLAAQILRGCRIVKVEVVGERRRHPTGAELAAALRRSRQRRGAG
jgi:hypothetical protein